MNDCSVFIIEITYGNACVYSCTKLSLVAAKQRLGIWYYSFKTILKVNYRKKDTCAFYLMLFKVDYVHPCLFSAAFFLGILLLSFIFRDAYEEQSACMGKSHYSS